MNIIIKICWENGLYFRLLMFYLIDYIVICILYLLFIFLHLWCSIIWNNRLYSMLVKFLLLSYIISVRHSTNSIKLLIEGCLTNNWLATKWIIDSMILIIFGLFSTHSTHLSHWLVLVRWPRIGMNLINCLVDVGKLMHHMIHWINRVWLLVKWLSLLDEILHLIDPIWTLLVIDINLIFFIILMTVSIFGWFVANLRGTILR